MSTLSDDNETRLAAYLAAAMKIAATQDLSQDRRPETRRLSISFAIVGVVFVILRFAARYKQSMKYALDDWLMLVSLVFMAGNFVCTIELVNNGLGLHSGALNLNEGMALGKILLVNEPLYIINLAITKISLLLMYFRIFPVRSMRIGGYILGGITIAMTVGIVILAETQCTPFNKNWEPWVAGHCLDVRTIQLVIAVPNILTDIGILCLPMPLIWKLQTNTVQKGLLSVIFLLGSFVVFTSIYRFTVYLNYDAKDLPYSLSIGCAWNVIEISSGIVSACVPTLGPLIRLAFSRINISLGLSSKGKSTKLKSRGTIGGGDASSRSRKLGSRTFEELTGAGESESDFRPAHGNKVSVNVASHGSDSEISHRSGDEIPLRTIGGIRKQRDVEWKEEWVGDGHDIDRKGNTGL